MNTQAYEEATDWLAKHREGDLDAQEKSKFDAWLRESPQHVRAYLEMSAIWENLPALDATWNPTPEELIARARSEGNVYPLVDTGRVTAAAPDSQDPRLESKESRPRGRARAGFFALAATLLIAIVAAVVTWYGLARNTYTTDIGEQRSIMLADGSTVELNARSRVRVRYTKAKRDVDLLEGQALFRVAHNTARPFIVHSGAADVRAVGTEFDVYKKRAATIVTVVEGKVAVLSDATAFVAAISPRATPKPNAASNSGGRNAIFVAAGEQITVAATPSSLQENSSAADSLQPANVSAAIAWRQRALTFESSPLTEVVEEFNRYNKRPLVITDPEIANIQISGIFSSQDPALLLKFLRTQPELNVEEMETEIRISKR